MNNIEPFSSFSPEEQRIFKRFPKMFRQADLPMQETCMCWGLETPEEWYPVIEKLAEDINNLAPDVVEFAQIKWKWSELRVYVDFVKEVPEDAVKEVYQLIDNAERDCAEIEKKLRKKREKNA